MNTENPTFDDLYFMYGTGRNYLISGTGRHKTTGYRQGVMCKLGDLVQAERKHLIPDKYAMERMGYSTLATLKKVYQHTMSGERQEVTNTINAQMNLLFADGSPTN